MLSPQVDLVRFPLAAKSGDLAYRQAQRAERRQRVPDIIQLGPLDDRLDGFHEVLAMVALGGNRYELRIRCFTLTGFFAVPRATDKVAMMSLRLMMPRR